MCPPDTPKKIWSELDVEVEMHTIAGTDLLGIYGVLLDDLLVLPYHAEEEIDFPHIKMPHRWNAWGNLIFGIGKKILLSKRVKEAAPIFDDMGYEVLVTDIPTPGSLMIGNKKGILLSYRIEDHKKEVEDFFGLPVVVGSLNSGFGYVGISAVANNNMALVGETSTGFEIARVSEALEV